MQVLIALKNGLLTYYSSQVHMRIRGLVTIVVLMLLYNNLIASFINSGEIITVSDGLPNSQLNHLYIGNRGNLFVSSNNGLYIYDGYEFHSKKTDFIESVKFEYNDLFSVAEDNSNNVWALTPTRVLIYDFSNNQLRIALSSRENKLFNQLVPDLDGGFMYVVCSDSIIQLNTKNLKRTTIFKSVSSPIYYATFFQNTLYILLEHKLTLIDTKFLTKKDFPVSHNPFINGNEILSPVDKNNILYLAGRKLVLYNLKAGVQKEIISFPAEITGISSVSRKLFGLSTSTEVYQIKLDSVNNIAACKKVFSDQQLVINQVVQDRSGIYWALSDKGIIKINPYAQSLVYQKLSSFLNVSENAEKLYFEGSKHGLIIKYHNALSFINSATSQKFSLPPGSCSSSLLIKNKTLLIGLGKTVREIGLTNNQILNNYDIDNSLVTSIQGFDEEVWISTETGLYQLINGKFIKKCSGNFKKLFKLDNNLYYLSEAGFGILNLIGCKSELIIRENSENDQTTIHDIIQSIDGKIWVATNKGLYIYTPSPTNIKSVTIKTIYEGSVFSLIEAANLPEIWFTTESGISSVNYQTQQVINLGYDDGIRQTTFIEGGALAGPKGELMFFTNDNVIHISPETIYRNNNQQQVIITSVSFFGREFIRKTLYPPNDTILINSATKSAQITLSNQDLYSPSGTRYLYSLVSKGEPENWKVLRKNTILLSGMPHGVYDLSIKAINSHGYESTTINQYTLIIRAPFYQSKLGMILFLTLLILLFLLFIQFRTRNLRRINKEYKEKERIAKKIEQQKEELSVKNKNITDSINYARRIQIAMMPSAKLYRSHFPDSFLLHMPKDIVSGDFYWVNHVGDNVFFSAVDCTGHGVPGAFMSIIGVELFRRITEIEKITTPSEVLNSLSKNFERVFGDVDEMKLRDGMDLAFCSLNKDSTTLEFAGAFNPLYIVRDSSIIEVKGDRHSVGVYHDDDAVRVFNNHIIPLHDGDLIYIFTDGFADQFGGPEGKKYKYRRFRHLLLALHQLPMEKQEEFLRKSILEWKGNLDQVDDILIMGLRIHQSKE